MVCSPPARTRPAQRGELTWSNPSRSKKGPCPGLGQLLVGFIIYNYINSDTTHIPHMHYLLKINDHNICNVKREHFEIDNNWLCKYLHTY